MYHVLPASLSLTFQDLLGHLQHFIYPSKVSLQNSNSEFQFSIPIQNSNSEFQFFIFKVYYWSKVDLQRPSNFRCTTQWMNCKLYIHPSLLWVSPILRSSPSRSSEHHAELPALYSRSPLVTCFIHGSDRCQSYSPNSTHPPLPPSCVHMSILYVCVSISAP